MTIIVFMIKKLLENKFHKYFLVINFFNMKKKIKIERMKYNMCLKYSIFFFFCIKILYIKNIVIKIVLL